MLNILPNVWVNPDQIESLHYQKEKIAGESLMLCMASGASFTVVQNVNEIMKEIEEYFMEPEAPVKRKYTKRAKPEDKL